MKLEIIGVNSWVLKYTHTYKQMCAFTHALTYTAHMYLLCVYMYIICMHTIYVCVNISQLSPLEAMRPGSNEPV